MSIGFVGLGNIGKPMAVQLLKLGEELWVSDLAAAPVAELVTRGARAAAHLKELAEHCELIGICVRDEPEVDALLQGPAGLLAQARPQALLAVHSTVTVAAIRRWAGQAEARGLQLIDAPVTGGASAAEAGTLTYMVGGTAQQLERCRAAFMSSGQKLLHAGPVGAGILLKLCNNLMTYAAFSAADEALRLARAGDLAEALLLEVGRSNGVVTPQMEAFVRNRRQLGSAGALARAFAPFAALARKDLAAALDSARELGVALPATECVHGIIEQVFLQQQ
jgi:3-hydroxyisobutyrate dehydrogenase-like beta-hydroxyacid dehydrogenase